MARRRALKAEWRPILAVERGILKNLSHRLFELDDNHRIFIDSLANQKSISQRQAWYLAWIANHYEDVYQDSELKWIADRMMEECPSSLPSQKTFMGKQHNAEPKTGYWEKPIGPEVPNILTPRQRKFRS